MKKYLLFSPTVWRLFGMAILLISGSSMAFAQANEPYIYGEIGGGDGSHGLFQMTLNTVLSKNNIMCSKNNIISISYSYASRRSPIPSDFYPGPAGFPDQTLSVFALSYGKVFFSKTPCVRFILKGGLCAGVAATPDFEYNTNYKPWVFSFSSNYDFSFQRKFVPGLVFNPAIEFPVGRAFGFSIGPYVNVNAVSSVLAVETSMMFGKIRGRKDGNH